MRSCGSNFFSWDRSQLFCYLVHAVDRVSTKRLCADTTVCICAWSLGQYVTIVCGPISTLLYTNIGVLRKVTFRLVLMMLPPLDTHPAMYVLLLLFPCLRLLSIGLLLPRQRTLLDKPRDLFGFR